MLSPLKNIHIVLVRPENPINIGQSARAMKNFGVSKLILVKAAKHKTPEAYTVGWKAKSLLDSAVRAASLKTVLKFSSFSVGFTTRTGRHRGQTRRFDSLLPHILEIAANHPVHFVFGNEKNGLSNEEMALCHIMATIPADKIYPSMNLSHAVVAVLSRLYACLPDSGTMFQKPPSFYPKAGEMESFLRDLHKTLSDTGYKKTETDRIHKSLVQFFKKSSLDKKELHLFRSFFARLREIKN